MWVGIGGRTEYDDRRLEQRRHRLKPLPDFPAGNVAKLLPKQITLGVRLRADEIAATPLSVSSIAQPRSSRIVRQIRRALLSASTINANGCALGIWIPGKDPRSG